MHLLEDRLSQNDTIRIGTASEVIFTADNNRDFIYILNNTAGKVVTIHKGDGTAIAGQGIVLAYGQAWYESDSSGYAAWRGAVSAISDGAATDLARHSTTRA